MDKHKTIIIPIDEPTYSCIIDSRFEFRKHLDALIEQYPELFPTDIVLGYILHGWTKPCKKVSIRRRRIFVKYSREEYLIHPCFVLPYLCGYTKAVSAGLRTRKYHLPYHVIAQTFGGNSMYWYRLECSLAFNNIVGTTIKKAPYLPKHILVDEHHDKCLGQKVYICTTVANEVFLGAALSDSVSFEALQKSYGVFKQESQCLVSDYTPLTINMDGFPSTRQTMKTLYPQAVIIRCFLHGYLKIQNNASKRHEDYFNHIADRVWYCYQATDKRSFAQRIRRVREWTNDFVPDSSFKTAILKLCEKKRISTILRLQPKSKNIKYVRPINEISTKKAFLRSTLSRYFAKC